MYVGYSLLPALYVILLRFHTIVPTDLLHRSSSTFQNFQVIPDLLSEVSQVSAPYKDMLHM